MNQKFEQLKALVALAEEDLRKFTEKGNRTAGTRLRKSMQEVKSIAQDIRKDVLSTKTAHKILH